jgi:CRP-like cAMP-binding protein
VEEGSEEDAFYVLVAGHVLVSKGGQEIDRIAPGECFGEMGYLGGGARSATVFARTAVACLRVSGALTQWASLPCQLRLSRAFQRTLIERLAQTSDQLSRRLSG